VTSLVFLCTQISRSNCTHCSVAFVHNKFLLIDPLTDAPTIVTGSANFSKASTVTNDENVLIIRGDTRCADIYFTEFMRLHAHFSFRSLLRSKRFEAGARAASHYLSDTDAWQSAQRSAIKRCERRLFTAQSPLV
jgi:phosphatidylserine/phosphatidylglycerophosphate/cardiolipin synthase-like enzyme